MKRGSGWLLSAITFIVLAIMTGTSFAADVSGLVNYSGTQHARIYLALKPLIGNTPSLGVSIPDPNPLPPSSPPPNAGRFTIRGVPDGTYTLQAFMDVSGQQTFHPGYPGSLQQIVVAGNQSGVAVTLTDTQASTNTPPDFYVSPGNGQALVMWDLPHDQDGWITPEFLKIYWSTDPDVLGTYAGLGGSSGPIPASDRNDISFRTGFEPGATIYFAMTAFEAGGGESAPATSCNGGNAPCAVVMTAPGGGHAVSGGVFIGQQASPSAIVVIASEGAGAYFTRIANPLPLQANPFSLNGVPDGNYKVYVILDKNDNGIIDPDDLVLPENSAPTITVNGADLTGIAATLPAPMANAFATVQTIHQLDDSMMENYSQNFTVEGYGKTPVNAAIDGGTHLSGPVDLAVTEWGTFEHWASTAPNIPAVGNSYSFSVVYDDGTTETINAGVSAVLNEFPIPVSPLGHTPYAAVPVFSWTPASPAPAYPYTYSLVLRGLTTNAFWEMKQIVPSQTEVTYNQNGWADSPELVDNASYTWAIAATDGFGNRAIRVADFSFGSGGGGGIPAVYASISGIVVDASGAGIAGVLVTVYDMSHNSRGSVATGTDGSYSVNGLAAGTYKVDFWDYTSTTNPYERKWYGNAADFASAAEVPVAQAEAVGSIDIQLARLGAVAGTVTADNDGAPLANVQVVVYDENNNWARSTTTDAAGGYSIGGLAAGEYAVYFDGLATGYFTKWHSDAADFDSATLETVADEETVTVDAALERAGSISGRLTDADSGAGIANVWVYAYQVSEFGPMWAGYAYTDDSGNYSVYGLGTGSYQVKFEDYQSGHVARWYDRQADQATAQAVPVTTGQDTPGINAALALGASIAGTLTSEAGLPLYYAAVQVYDVNQQIVASGGTDNSGNYSIRGLPGGNYRLHFDGMYGGYLPEWYDNAATFAAAAPISVTAPTALSGFNAVLASAGSISGTVRDGVGNVIPNVMVTAYDPVNVSKGSAWTDQSGSYILGGLAAGDYKVSFSGYGYKPEWHADAADFSGAALVSVTPSAAATVDAVLTRLGRVTGTVTAENGGAPLANIQVVVYGENNSWGASTTTDAAGGYSIVVPAAGNCKVYFDGLAAGYFAEWHSDAADFESARLVQIADEGVVTIDAALGKAGSISGRLTDADSGAGIAGATVTVYQDPAVGQMWGGYAFTDDNGYYTVNGLSTGSYKVRFEDYLNGHLARWYDNQADQTTGQAVPATAGQDTPGINAALTMGASIAGALTNESGVPLVYISVMVYDANQQVVSSGLTDYSGNYIVQGLPTGSYRLHFETLMSGRYVPEWYNDAATFAGAAPISVTAPSALSGYDVVLAQTQVAKPGSISVTAGGTPGNYSVSWAASATEGVTYTLQESADPNFGTLTETVNAVSPVTVIGKTAGTYYYRVKAVKADFADSGWVSGSCVVTIQVAKPGWIWTPATSSDGAIYATWGASSTPGVIYVLEEANNTSFTGAVEVYRGTGLRTSLIVGHANGNWYMRVKAVVGYLDSIWVVSTGEAVAIQAKTPSWIWTPVTSTDGAIYATWGSSAAPGVIYVLEEANNSSFTGAVEVYRGTALRSPLMEGHANATWYMRVKAVVVGCLDSAWVISTGETVAVQTKTPSWIWTPVTSTDGAIYATWGSSASSGVTYVLEEANNSSFIGAVEVYRGNALRSQLIGGHANGTWYMRVKAVAVGCLDSAWAVSSGENVAVQAKTPSWIWTPATNSNGSVYATWVTSATPGVTYVVQEANNLDFTNAVEVYSGTALRSPVTSGHATGTWYLRVKATASAYIDSPWVVSTGCVVP